MRYDAYTTSSLSYAKSSSVPRPRDAISPTRRSSRGVETSTGRCYVSFPVSSGVVDYEEYYEITAQQHRDFIEDHEVAVAFIQSCRRRERDESLMHRPGWNRGIPT